MKFEKYKIRMVEPIIGHPKVKYEIYEIIYDEDIVTPFPHIHVKTYAENLKNQLNMAYNTGYDNGYHKSQDDYEQHMENEIKEEE